MTDTDMKLAVVEAQEVTVKEPGKGQQEIQEERQAKLAHLLTTGDLSKMTKPQKDEFLCTLAQLHGLMPWPPPFIVMVDKKTQKESIYATKSCADQLRKIHGISLEVVYQGPLELGAKSNADVYCVRVQAKMPDGRTDEELGAVSIANLVGEDLSNAVMRAITKAKRRVTYTITGLSLPDADTEAPREQAQLGGPRYVQPQIASVAGPPRVEIVVDAEKK